MSQISSRRRPFPWHLRLGSAISGPNDRIGLMLLANDSGLLIGKKQQTLEGVVPTQQEYSSAPIYRERTFTCKPTGGYGERVQSSHGDKRYYWGMDVTVNGGLVGKGPLVHPIVPATSTGLSVRKFIDAMNGSTLTQFVLGGARVYRRADDTNGGQVVDTTLGAVATDAARFKGGFAGATDALYVTTAAGGMSERTPAGTWTACALPAGFLTQRLEVIGTELWAADCDNSVLRKVTSDPKVAANWSGPFFVGDPSTKITAIRQTANTLVIFKEDGSIFTLNSDGTTNDLYPGLTGPVSSENGLRAQAWMNALWFRIGPSFYRLDMPGASLVPIGPGKLLDNASPVRGESRVFCGWGGYQGYLGLWNQQDNVSYLLSYGSWEMKQSEDGASSVFDDQWDGALAHWTGRKITALSVSGASGQERLYIGFEDGGWDWIKLVQSPLATGSGAEFSLGPSEIVLPLHTAMFQADIKQWTSFTIFGPVMRVGDEAIVSYRIMASAGGPPTDPTGDWLALGTFQANGQTIDAPPALAGSGLQLKIGLVNSSTSTTPVIDTIAIHERVVPAFRRDFSGTVDGRLYTSRLDGAAARLSPERVHQAMMNAVTAPQLATLEMPDETVEALAFFNYSERMLPRSAGGGGGWLIDFQATEFRLLTVYGIVSRLLGTHIADLSGYSIDSLRYL